MISEARRRRFTALLVGWLLVASLLSLIRIAAHAQPTMAWVGALLAASSSLCWFGANQVLARSLHPLGFTVASCLGVSISMTVAWRYGPAAESALLVAGGSLIAWVIYLRWIRIDAERKTGDDRSD